MHSVFHDTKSLKPNNVNHYDVVLILRETKKQKKNPTFEEKLLSCVRL